VLVHDQHVAQLDQLVRQLGGRRGVEQELAPGVRRRPVHDVQRDLELGQHHGGRLAAAVQRIAVGRPAVVGAGDHDDRVVAGGHGDPRGAGLVLGDRGHPGDVDPVADQPAPGPLTLCVGADPGDHRGARTPSAAATAWFDPCRPA